MSERDDLAAVIERAYDLNEGMATFELLAHATLAAGYRKTDTVTEYGIVFNGSAVFLTPPADSLDEFKERYEREHGWMITDRDTFLTRTYSRCAPEPSAPVIHELTP